MKTGALEIRVLIHLMAAMPSSMSPTMKQRNEITNLLVPKQV